MPTFEVNGSPEAAAQESISGIASMRRKTSLTKPLRCERDSYLMPERFRSISLRRSGLKPGVSLDRNQRLFVIRIAPLNRSRDNATSATISASLNRSRSEPALVVRPASRSTCAMFIPDAVRKAGLNPEITAVNIERTKVKPTTRQSRTNEVDAMPWPKKSFGNFETRIRTVQELRTRPAQPASRAKSSDSVKSCLTSRISRPPRAVRIPISARRALPRARSKLATLVQAISRTKPAAPAKRDQLSRTISEGPHRRTETL